MPLLEVCCFNPENAILAGSSGADRIELCADKDAGGTTPPRSWLTEVRPHVTIPVFVMIRPRGGVFHYSAPEFEQMKAAIDDFKAEAEGFVLGILTTDREVDVERTTELVRRAAPRPCTFHRAFDQTPDPYAALDDVISTGCRAILTSGGALTAAVGADTLAGLVTRAQGRIVIIPGGDVRSNNLALLQARTMASTFHSSCMLGDTTRLNLNELRRVKEILNST